MYSQEGPGDRLNILSAVYLIILSGNKLYCIVNHIMTQMIEI